MTKTKKADAEKLLRLWEHAKYRLGRWRSKADELETGDDGIAFAGRQLDEAYKDLSDLQKEFIATCKDDEISNRQDLFDKEEDLYQAAKLNLEKLTSERVQQPSPSDSHITDAPAQQLPKLDLPAFSGTVEEWPSFSDLFKSIVHDNSRLTGSQKLQYLKCSLTGSASCLIRNITITDDNYEVAWAKLTKRYQNRRKIVRSHIDKLLTHPNVTATLGSLQELLDATDDCVRQLRVLQQPVDSWDVLLMHIVYRKLDNDTKADLEKQLKDDSMPSYAPTMEFLQQRATSLDIQMANEPEQLPQTSTQPCSNSFTRSNSFQSQKASKYPSTPQNKSTPSCSNQQFIPQRKRSSCCPACQGSHEASRCSKFHNLSFAEKQAMAKEYKLCYNCLSPHHAIELCQGGRCRKCGKKHHTSLHRDTATSNHAYSHSTVLLSTAIVHVMDASGERQKARALIDPGSQTSLVSESFFKGLGLSKQANHQPIKGVGSNPVSTTTGNTSLDIESTVDDTYKLRTTALVLRKVTDMLPSVQISDKNWPHTRTIKLADPTFHIPGKIDLLLGADVYGHIVEEGVRRGPPQTPTAQNTKLGWILVGETNTSPQQEDIKSFHCTLDTTLRQFFELESVPQQKHLKPEEEACKKNYKETTVRLNGGRYQVDIPFKNQTLALGLSRNQAIQRLLSLEKKFKADPSFHKRYKGVMEEYIHLKHMESVPFSRVHAPVAVYLPHHAVHRDTSLTTKLRVVFDASAKTSNGRTLNDEMMNGPTLQDDIFTILLRFRSHEVAITADIAKMYRQISVNSNHRDFQRIVWRNSPEEPIQDFRLTTVTFGTKAAPYLAIQTLHQLAEDEKETYPTASIVMKRDFYVDDLLTGAPTVQEAIQLQTEVSQLAASGGFELRKWTSSSTDVLEAISPSQQGPSSPMTIHEDEITKTLGLQWHHNTDHFAFTVSLQERPFNSKRTLLSDASKIFDPLGWLSPITIQGKILFQQLWLRQLSWDDKLPVDIDKAWSNYRVQLPVIENIAIPRRVFPADVKRRTLCGFADASTKAYAAVVYIRTETESGSVHVTLATAKTKVAPLRTKDITYLELCAACLLAKLLNLVSNILNIPQIEAWTDSTVTLAWIAAHPSQWKQFVANRVSVIHELTSPSAWHHVKSTDNPADCASRGILPSELPNHLLWWNGPKFLHRSDFDHTSGSPMADPKAVSTAKRKAIVLQTTADNPEILLNQHSSLRKLLRTTAIIKRFISACQTKKRSLGLVEKGKPPEPLSAAEINGALHHWVAHSQAQAFSLELHQLRADQRLSKRSSLLSLCPFLDEQGILRVGGRLKHASIPLDQKHPMLLLKNSHLTTLVITQAHVENLHAGPQLLASILRQRFWILGAKDIIRKIIHRCVICHRLKAQATTQMMANLPSARVTMQEPFQTCGVDFAGPFHYRTMVARGSRTSKAYAAIFVCFATKAVHIELVSNLTTAAFLASLDRFCNRRGRPTTIYSDNATNFVGANKELTTFLKLQRDTACQDSISNHLSSQGISWKFNPPAAPHFGGLWEAGVKSMKFHIKRVLQNTVLNFEELTTLLTSVEACLNSRPLTELSSDPNDLDPLTPGHFLVGRPMKAHPTPDLQDIPTNRLSRWQLVQQLRQSFWKRWSTEYLSRLQQRPKWLREHENITTGALVLLKDENSSPLEWKLGRIIAVHPGDDTLVRVVTVKTASGTYSRPIVKICPLPDYIQD